MAYLDIAALQRNAAEDRALRLSRRAGFRARRALSATSSPTIRRVPGPGSHPLSELTIDGHFKGLLDELNGPEFRHAIEDKFGIDLLSRPTMFTVRGECRASDGKIHTDSATKLITVLLYMNEKWDKDGGRLRILRNGTDLDDYAEEVPPHGGTLLVFRRSENSWHGHQPFDGPRRAIQMNWVTDKSVVAREQGRHRISSTIKKLNPFRKAS